MPSIRSFALLACLHAALTLTAQQSLVCPPVADPGRPCARFHYHAQLYNPETKQFFELTAGDAFATQASCERAREARVAANAQVVAFYRSAKDQKYPEDRTGPCHCDLTGEKSSAAYVAEAQRIAQRRTAGEVRMRVRERLLAKGLTSDAEIIRALLSDPPVTPQLSGPKHPPMPAGSVAAPPVTADDLQTTRGPEAARGSVAALELPLVDEGGAAASATTGATGAATSGAPLTTGTVAAPSAKPGKPAQPPPSPPVESSEPLVETNVEEPVETVTSDAETEVEATTADEPSPAAPAPEAVAQDDRSAQETAEQFVAYETQRIQLVLSAAGAIADQKVKSQIFEACQQRIRLLTNLRLLIEGSGSRSALAVAARNASTEEQRLALIATLFGDDIPSHWAPKDAADVIVPFDEASASDPENVLRDSAGRFSVLQKKHALYALLATAQPTEEQRLWLSSVVESFLR